MLKYAKGPYMDPRTTKANVVIFFVFMYFHHSHKALLVQKIKTLKGP